ncbi:MAG: sulfatase-like hydrolase/transferase [Planctomycetota bacterium]|nr:sulfatase-like hydrolase/transferase [Planctomycetota bacterium]
MKLTMRTPIFALVALFACSVGLSQARPNLLWITSEDNGPHLGCYGDDYADTPNLDGLAARGLRYLNVWSNAPVCAPARTAIISGLYPTSTGSQHMRSQARLPAGMSMFPQLLREAGYYCVNRAKKDYNLEETGRLWDVSSGKAHWRGRGEGQPFFMMWNIGTSHESQIRRRPHKAVHDAAGVRVPAYHPDRPEVRRDWAQYYDKLTQMDAQVGRILAQLDADGLREDTIVVYFGDHGPGMPRSKRTACNSGLHVPLLVSVPERFADLAPADYRSGGVTGRLVSFVDLAPTTLSLVGIEPPSYLQGNAFAGPFASEPPATMHGFRGRMDERYDMVRSARDQRYVYVRNFMPHRVSGQHVDYMFQTPTTRVWRSMFEAGELNAEQSAFWLPRPAEELYDLLEDPDEVRNLAGSAEHREILEGLRIACREHQLAVRDLGLLPEAELIRRAAASTPYEMGHDPEAYPLQRLLAMADLATSAEGTVADLIRGLSDEDCAVRYWAAMGVLARGAAAVDAAGPVLQGLLRDESPTVRVVAAEALVRYGDEAAVRAGRAVLLACANLETESLFVVVQALNAIDAVDYQMRPDKAALEGLPRESASVPRRLGNYVPRLLDKILADLAAYSHELPPVREVVYKRVGDVRLTLFLSYPVADPDRGALPAVVLFHGGGWTGGSPSQFDDQCRHLAGRGVVGITAAYRLLNTNTDTASDCVADAMSAIRWVRQNAQSLGIDPNRIAAGGGSAGGHIAAAATIEPGADEDPGSDVSCRPDALVLFNAVLDNSPDGLAHKLFGDRYRDVSPFHNIHEGLPPTLIMLGTEDEIISVESAQSYHGRMQEEGVRCDLRLYEGQTHGFFNRSRSAQMYRATVADMDAFLADLGWM